MLRENNVRSGFFERDQFEDVRAAPAPHLGAGRPHCEDDSLEPGTTKNAEGRILPYDRLPELSRVINMQWREHELLQKRGRLVPHVFH